MPSDSAPSSYVWTGAAVLNGIRRGETAILVALVALVTLANPAFLSPTNLANMLSQWAPAGIMAVGMTYVIIAGGFDLSIASSFSFCAVISAFLGQHLPWELAAFLAVSIGTCVGLVNALLIAKLDVNPFIATIGIGFVVSGITLASTKNSAFLVTSPGFAWIGTGSVVGVPVSGLLMVVIFIAAMTVLNVSIPGRTLYAVGGNREASRVAGMPVSTAIGATYVFMGACAGIAGFISASQLSSAQANMDSAILFDVLTIVIVGGTPLGGGAGSLGRTVIGLGIVGTISNGFVLADVNPYYQDIIKGLIIIGALILPKVRREVGR